jgi:hypothetical protein
MDMCMVDVTDVPDVATGDGGALGAGAKEIAPTIWRSWRAPSARDSVCFTTRVPLHCGQACGLPADAGAGSGAETGREASAAVRTWTEGGGPSG